MLQIGWAERDITPKRPAMLQGQMHCRIGHEAMDPLTLTALAMEGADASDCAILVSCDIAYVSAGLLQAVRSRLARMMPEVSGEKIVLNATHTHTSLVIEDGFYKHPGGDVMTAAECETWVAEHAAQAAAEAWQGRRPRTVGQAFGHAVVGHNRYALYADGHAQMYGRTSLEEFVAIPGYEDHSVDILFTWDLDGKLAGLALAIPCPSQVDEGLDRFSADFWHEIRAELRKRLGEPLHVLPLCAAAGDQSPHFLLYGPQEEEMRRRRGVTERQEIAQRVGDAVDRALLCTQPPPDGPTRFAHAVKHLELPPIRISRKERDWAFAERERWIAKRGEAESWWPQRLNAVVECADGLRKPEPFTAETHALRLGDAAIVTNPFELFLDYSLRIKARSPAAQTVVVQLAGDKGFYLPTERALQGGGYGAMPAVSLVGPEGGSKFVEETLKSLRLLWP